MIANVYKINYKQLSINCFPATKKQTKKTVAHRCSQEFAHGPISLILIKFKIEKPTSPLLKDHTGSSELIVLANALIHVKVPFLLLSF